MERSEIRDSSALLIGKNHAPDCASLHPGYDAICGAFVASGL